MSCTDDQIATVTRPPIDQLYWSLHTDMRAITVAVNGTQQLVVAPLNKANEPIPNPPAAVYVSADPTKVTVDSAGVITGIAPTDGVIVTAALTMQGITYVDTATVAVTTTSAVMQSVQLQIPPGGAILGAGGAFVPMNGVALDAEGNAIPGVAVSIVTLDPDRVGIYSFGPGTLVAQGQTLGKVRIIAAATAYGVTKADTVIFNVLYPTTGDISSFVNEPQPGVDVIQFQPDILAIAVGGTVTWQNYNNIPIDVTFENGLDNIVGGNIDEIDPFDQQSRQFTAPGTYNYKSNATGATGSVIVHTQPTL
jgi:plastocyanin